MSEHHSGTNDPHASPYENAVFVSYKWGGEGEEIVNQIERALQARGIKLIRDKRDLGFKGSIRKFMERMGRGTCVIVVINDAYLRSKHCMFELMEIAEAEQFHDRVFPVVLGDADIYDPVKIIGYIKYWEEKQAELTEAMRSVDQANLQGIRDEIDLYDRIRDEISGLISTLNDMNTLSPELHQRGDYAIVADAIAERMRSNDSAQQQTIRDLRLDAAMPKECQVDHTTEVRVLIALPDSEGLNAHLPDYTISRELIDKRDVEGARTPINFPYDPNTRQLVPTYLYVKIDAPDFRFNQRVQKLLVPPDKNSETLTFFLTPNKLQSVGRVSAKLYQDEDCIIALGSVTLTTKVERKKLSVELQAAIVGAIATIFAAIWATGLGPYLWGAIVRTPIPSTPTPACVTANDILVRLQVWNGPERIDTLVPSGRINLQPGLTVDLKVDFQSVSGKVLPTLECAWENASSANPNSATEGRFLHTTGCSVDYQSGHTKIEDALSLRVSQPSCPDLSSYAFFVFPK